MHRLSLVVTSQGYSLVSVLGLLTAVVSLVAEHRLYVGRGGSIVAAHGLNCPSACRIFLRIEPTSSVLAGRFFTTGPPGKSPHPVLWWNPLHLDRSFLTIWAQLWSCLHLMLLSPSLLYPDVFFQGTFIWLHCVLVATGEFLSCGTQTLSWSMWHLIPWPGIEPGPPTLRAQSPNHCAHQGFYPLPSLSSFPATASPRFLPVGAETAERITWRGHCFIPAAQQFLCNSSLKARVMLFLNIFSDYISGIDVSNGQTLFKFMHHSKDWDCSLGHQSNKILFFSHNLQSGLQKIFCWTLTVRTGRTAHHFMLSLEDCRCLYNTCWMNE